MDPLMDALMDGLQPIHWFIPVHFCPLLPIPAHSCPFLVHIFSINGWDEWAGMGCCVHSCPFPAPFPGPFLPIPCPIPAHSLPHSCPFPGPFPAPFLPIPCPFLPIFDPPEFILERPPEEAARRHCATKQRMWWELASHWANTLPPLPVVPSYPHPPGPTLPNPPPGLGVIAANGPIGCSQPHSAAVGFILQAQRRQQSGKVVLICGRQAGRAGCCIPNGVNRCCIIRGPGNRAAGHRCSLSALAGLMLEQLRPRWQRLHARLACHACVPPLFLFAVPPTAALKPASRTDKRHASSASLVELAAAEASGRQACSGQAGGRQAGTASRTPARLLNRPRRSLHAAASAQRTGWTCASGASSNARSAGWCHGGLPCIDVGPSDEEALVLTAARKRAGRGVHACCHARQRKVAWAQQAVPPPFPSARTRSGPHQPGRP